MPLFRDWKRVLAFVVLRAPHRASAEMEESLIAYCREHLIKWSCPREIEFRERLPKTRIGKIAFNALREEAIARRE